MLVMDIPLQLSLQFQIIFFLFLKVYFESYLLKYSQEDVGFFKQDLSYPDYAYTCHHNSLHRQQQIGIEMESKRAAFCYLICLECYIIWTSDHLFTSMLVSTVTQFRQASQKTIMSFCIETAKAQQDNSQSSVEKICISSLHKELDSFPIETPGIWQ